ncbi:MAG: hypothetical protein GY725_24505 [bacterium]|nr:hypothetical protein [bacterium]
MSSSRKRLWQALLLGSVIAAPLGWLASEELESHDGFCVSCHLDAATVLHADKLADFESLRPVNLASVHRLADPQFRCITCHRGAGLGNRLRVKAVAARDALLFVLGRFGEPERMKQPLWDEDCVQCHPGYDPEREDAYHAIGVHNRADFDVRCVECHLAHPKGGNEAFSFLIERPVNRACQLCHEEF